MGSMGGEDHPAVRYQCGGALVVHFEYEVDFFVANVGRKGNGWRGGGWICDTQLARVTAGFAVLVPPKGNPAAVKVRRSGKPAADRYKRKGRSFAS
jgi:hypothetical protein